MTSSGVGQTLRQVGEMRLQNCPGAGSGGDVPGSRLPRRFPGSRQSRHIGSTALRAGQLACEHVLARVPKNGVNLSITSWTVPGTSAGSHSSRSSGKIAARSSSNRLGATGLPWVRFQHRVCGPPGEGRVPDTPASWREASSRHPLGQGLPPPIRRAPLSRRSVGGEARAAFAASSRSSSTVRRCVLGAPDQAMIIGLPEPGGYLGRRRQ